MRRILFPALLAHASIATGAGRDSSFVDAVVRRHQNQIRHCYERELHQRPELEGNLVMVFDISTYGSVVQTAVEHSTLQADEVEQCLMEEFKAMVFSVPDGWGELRVRYPLAFSPRPEPARPSGSDSR